MKIFSHKRWYWSFLHNLFSRINVVLFFFADFTIYHINFNFFFHFWKKNCLFKLMNIFNIVSLWCCETNNDCCSTGSIISSFNLVVKTKWQFLKVAEIKHFISLKISLVGEWLLGGNTLPLRAVRGTKNSFCSNLIFFLYREFQKLTLGPKKIKFG